MLSRCSGEEILIGSDIVLHVGRIMHGSVRFQITLDGRCKRYVARRNENVRITPDVLMVVNNVSSHWARFGFDAPQTIKILRAELVAED